MFIIKTALLVGLAAWVVTHRPSFWPLLVVLTLFAVAC